MPGLRGPRAPQSTPSAEPPVGASIPLRRSVLLILHNPRIQSASGRPLWQVLGWNDPDDLTGAFIRDLADCSYGLAQYEVVDRVDVDDFPPKQDGFSYSEDHYLGCWRARRGFHQPDLVDYRRIFAEFDVIARVNEEEFQEVWLFGFPYAGYYESIMAGPGAFWCNAPPLSGVEGLHRRVVIMGFNYERGVGEMLESYGHRAESIMARVYAGKRGEANLWERFTRYDKSHPGQAEVGNVHFAPNSSRDYDWGSRKRVWSRCDDWYDYPDLQGRGRQVNCEEWGNGDIRLHHLWWFRHFPHVAGMSHDISHNWWEYVVDPDRVT